MTNSRFQTCFLVCWIAVLFAGYAVISFFYPATLYPDSAWGFITLDGMLRGAPFNHRLLPDPADISLNIAYSNAWWSPGQYLVPWAVARLSGCVLGNAIWITVLLSGAAGLAGYYYLAQRLGFSRGTALAVTAFLAGMRYFSLGFLKYHGGEALFFGIMPWTILSALSARSLKWRQMPFLLTVFLTAVFFKLSFLVYGTALGLALTVNYLMSGEAQTDGKKPLFLLRATVFFFLFYAVSYYLFLRTGYTIPGTMEKFRFSPLHLTGSAAFLLSSGMSIMDLVRGAMTILTSNTAIQWQHLSLLLAVTSLVSVLAVFALFLSDRSREYRVILGVFYCCILTAMSVFYLTGAKIGLDERHFRPVGILFLFAFFEAVPGIRSGLLRFLAVLFFSAQALYGTVSFAVFHLQQHRDSVTGNAGFSLAGISQAELRTMSEIDRLLPVLKNNLFFVPEPSLSLEIRNSRPMPLNTSRLSAEQLAGKSYRGRVDNLVIMLPAGLYGDPKGRMLLRSFQNYDRRLWQCFRSGRYLYFVQGTDAVSVAKKLGLAQLASPVLK